MFHEGVVPYYKGTRAPVCEHGEPATLRISNSEQNRNRGFFACNRKKEEGCKTFQWADEHPTYKTLKAWKEYDTLFRTHQQAQALPKKVEMADKACSPIKKAKTYAGQLREPKEEAGYRGFNTNTLQCVHLNTMIVRVCEENRT